MPQATIRWDLYNRKHWARNGDWKEQVKDTKDGPAKYWKEIDVRQFEESIVEHETNERNESVLTRSRKIVPGNCRFLYCVFDRIIGASDGKETDIVRVQWDADGTLHGRPFNESQLTAELGRKNPTELEYFRGLREKK